MQGKGLITIVAIVLGLICINELLPTWYSHKIENDAKAFAKGDEAKYNKELARLSKDTFNLGFTKLVYPEAKQKEMKLGLDLKGGINVLLEINQRDLVNDLTNYTTNPIVIEALDRTDKAQKQSTKPYIEDFFTQFDAVNQEKHANLKLANPEVFGTQKLSGEIKFNSSDDDVKRIIRNKIDASVGTAFEVIRTRIDKMGAVQPNVQRVPGTGRIAVEMPGIKDKDKVKKMLSTSAKLQFWEVQNINEVFPYFEQLSKIVPAKADSLGVAKSTNFLSLLQLNSLSQGVGNIKLTDTAAVNKIINSPIAIKLRPANLKFTKFMWGYKPQEETPDNLVLYAIRGNISQKAPVDGAVDHANINYDNLGRIVVDMQMDTEGTKDWATLTEKNVGKPVAVTLDNVVYTAPRVNEKIPSGRSQISGNFTQEEAKELTDVLSAGKLPASAKVVQADVVGPSLGQESINAGLMSFVIAFLIIVVYIIFYYGGAGVYAIIAMIFNLFYLFGIMDSINATLTLPGIAGIVLTMAIAVDTNVIIYERTKEELFLGKSIKQAYTDGFKHALNAIIDGHLTSLLTALVLFIFGTGPIKGFAVTTGIGLIMTFFTSVLLSRVMIFHRLNKGKGLSVWTPITKNWFRNIWIDFIGKRKYAYVFSLLLTSASLISMFTLKFKTGVDFQGGRSYVVRFDKDVDATEAHESLAKLFVLNGESKAVDVKTFGNSDQLKITTDYKIDDESINADQEIEKKLYEGLKKYLPSNVDLSEFKEAHKGELGIVSSSKVGPTVADDIKTGGTYAVLASLLGIFIYILFRFNKWQFSLGAVVALAHDAIIILGFFSFFKNIMPFNMEINQDFIAAILTVLGYSINDTVIVFDRIREYLREKKSLTLAGLFDDSISSTLGRTFNTSFTVLLVIMAIFFFGGENLRGFMFALFLGIFFGTYSSIFVASAIAYDFLKTGKEEAPHEKTTSEK